MIGIALLGAGRMAHVHAESMKGTDARIVTVNDLDAAAAEKLAALTGATACRTAEEAIGHPEVAGVLVAASHTAHVALTLKAVEAGKRVLCEKPLATSYPEAVRCVDVLGKEADRVFLAFNRRFDPGHSELQKRVANGDIGNVEQLTIACRDAFMSTRDYIANSAGIFRDMMVHDFDMMRWILREEPVTIFAQGSALIEPWVAEMGDIDTGNAMLRTASGKLVLITNSRRSSMGFDQRVEAVGSKGMLLSDNLPRTGLKQFGPGGSDAVYETSDRLRAFFLERYRDSYRLEVSAFIDCIRNDADAPVNARDGLAATYIAEAATRSYKTNQPVTLRADHKVDWEIEPPVPGKSI
ncbi:Gfo/Idh/MocA family oxidoreductase [Shinella sp. BYT-45]|uniref:Gfo/Idh/MocA family protein n=1 Tax=Shinella sp. BYT-45 TaxID=3377377 RepID=UPI0039801A81